jgi:vacuolar-type H+-ATPase catalytic subunit A/Vma1
LDQWILNEGEKLPAGVDMHRMVEIVMKMSMKTITKMNMTMREVITSKHLRGMEVRKMNMKTTTKTSMMMRRIMTMTKMNIKELHQDTTMKIMAMSLEEIQATVHGAHPETDHVGLHQWIVKTCAA